MPLPNKYNQAVGLLKIGAISSKGYNISTGKVFVQLNEASSISNNTPIEIQLPLALFDNDGMFIGALPKPGTPVVVGQGVGGQYHFVSWAAQNITNLPIIKLGELLIQGNEDTQIKIDVGSTNTQKNDIYIGSKNNRLHVNSIDNYSSSNFDNNYNFTQASRSVNGLIKRDLKRNTRIPQSSKLDQDAYENMFYTIGLDPLTAVNSIAADSKKNPAFVETRELIYEFEYNSGVMNDLQESALYSNKPQTPEDSALVNRRQSKSDTLSLTLAEPNFLMESIKGTVVDIFGNILDLNRSPLRVGSGQNTLSSDQSKDKVKSFLLIKELERKSLALHFELNARKNLVNASGDQALPDINSNADYSRNRSRLFIDIDKEGQFNINIPASSETGNIPLLTRYENFSTLANKPSEFLYREDNLDIFQDSFAAAPTNLGNRWKEDAGISWDDKGCITIKDEDGYTTPVDRITGKNIKKGSPYHDIRSTCYAMSGTQFINYQNDLTFELGQNINVDDIATANSKLDDICSNIITISGKTANAGGRSGTINLDGSFELYLGANTSDRQSLLMDFAGGIVGNVGRDLKNMSMALSMDGDVYWQIGGLGVGTDSRFVKENNGPIGAVLDIRVITDGGFASLVRIDNTGVSVMTPSKIKLHSGQGMQITSDANINIDCEELYLQNRQVLKFGDSI